MLLFFPQGPGYDFAMKKLRVALIAGGFSGERDVSLRSGDAVERGLDPDRYEVARYDPRQGLGELIRARQSIDLAFVLLHGRHGEDGSIQGFLECLQIPYVGSGVLASAAALHKRVAKDIFRGAGLRVAEDVTLHRAQPVSVGAIAKTLGPFTVVKPASEGSSLGVAVCRSPEELKRGIESAFAHDEEILVERLLEGKELTGCVLGNERLEALPLIEIIPNPEYPFFDYRAKYTPGATNERCPAEISEAQAEEARAAAKGAHRALRCRVWSRTDMILCKDGIYVLETNTIPGMTETSLVPLAAKTAGLSFPGLLDRLIALSLAGPHRVPREKQI